jgi:hypothetical protein
MMPPRFVAVAAGAGVTGLVLSLGIAWQVDRWSEAEAKRDCQRSVNYRDDNRAMWLYLVDANTGTDQARVDAFVSELNARLPVLVCVNGDAIPKP